MKRWLYNDPITGQIIEYTNIDQFPQTIIGFVYKITCNTTGKIYIGKKSIYSNQNKLLTKKEISEWDKPGRVPRKKKVTKESDWLSYYGSSKELLDDVKLLGYDNYTREIIKMCTSKKNLSYYETYWQFHCNVLHIESYNSNILGKFFRKDV
jgi:hypothetical protein